MSESLPISIWPVAQEMSRTQRKDRYLPESMAHPGKMLPAIARHAIEAYTKPGDLVADPMCGIGTTLVEAMHLGRSAFGVEYEPRWAELANANIEKASAQGATGTSIAHCDDGRNVAALAGKQLHGQFQLVITSPPYGPSLHGQVATADEGVAKSNDRYSDDRANLGHASTSVLLDSFREIVKSCALLLKPGGIVMVTTRPWRRQRLLIDLPGAVIRLAGITGLEPFERNIALLCALRDDQLVARASFFQLDYVRKARRRGMPLSVIAHEDVIVLRKPGHKRP